MIDELHKMINFLHDKGITGYHPSDKIDAEIGAVSIELWNKYYELYQKTQKIHDFLSPFEVVSEAISIINGKCTIPKALNIEHPTLVMLDDDTEVSVVSRAQWGKTIKDPVAPPSEQYPKCVFSKKDDSGYLVEWRPRDISAKAFFWGLKKPVKPKWGYTITADGIRAYDKSTSTNLEWSELLYPDIRDRVCIKLGINLRELSIVQSLYPERQEEA